MKGRRKMLVSALDFSPNPGLKLGVLGGEKFTKIGRVQRRALNRVGQRSSGLYFIKNLGVFRNKLVVL